MPKFDILKLNELMYSLKKWYIHYNFSNSCNLVKKGTQGTHLYFYRSTYCNELLILYDNY